MIESKLLKHHLDGGFVPPKRVLDLGCGFPRNLFDILYRFRSCKVVGVDVMYLPTISRHTSFREELFKKASMSCEVFNAVIDDEDDILSFYLAHKLYMRLIVNEQSNDIFGFKSFSSLFNFYSDTSIEDYLSGVHTRSDEEQFDLIIASKSLSWISAHEFQDVFEKIKKLLKPRGYIFLRLNSDDFKVDGHSIRRVFTQQDVTEIIESLKYVKTETTLQRRGDDEKGKRIFEIIGMLK